MYQGLGRRKTSVARVTLKPGTGKIFVNKKAIDDYFPYQTLIQDATQGLKITKTDKSFDVTAHVEGGGFSGQAGALRHGIVRALIVASEDYKKPLKAAGLVTRDSRIKERKKPGLRKARRARQFSKR